jgi:hypothetical protein
MTLDEEEPHHSPARVMFQGDCLLSGMGKIAQVARKVVWIAKYLRVIDSMLGIESWTCQHGGEDGRACRVRGSLSRLSHVSRVS